MKILLLLLMLNINPEIEQIQLKIEKESQNIFELITDLNKEIENEKDATKHAKILEKYNDKIENSNKKILQFKELLDKLLEKE